MLCVYICTSHGPCGPGNEPERRRWRMQRGRSWCRNTVRQATVSVAQVNRCCKRAKLSQTRIAKSSEFLFCVHLGLCPKCRSASLYMQGNPDGFPTNTPSLRRRKWKRINDAVTTALNQSVGCFFFCFFLDKKGHLLSKKTEKSGKPMLRA